VSGTEEKCRCSVLLAEDNRINQKLVVLMLGKLGIDPDIAVDGIQAVEMALQKQYDVILMDMHMPGMNGLNATKKIKSVLGEKSPVIVALTADVIPENVADALKGGVDAYLTKPISQDMLRECFEKYCGNEE